jgi:2-dehydro-3-deoxyphosphogluconate aldolase/(4S)-4-hydroxy-2-oxoglutarate aldolase
MTQAEVLRRGPVAARIRAHRLLVVLRRIEPRDALLALVDELHDAGARIFEITMDGPDAAADLRAVCEHAGPGSIVGAGTVLTAAQLDAARAAGAAFAVAPVLDATLVARAATSGTPFMAGAMTPTEVHSAWEAGATFVKLFPASAVGPSFVREVRGPMPEVELVPTGGIDGANARAFLDAGAVAVGIGGAIVRADPAARRRIVADVVGWEVLG